MSDIQLPYVPSTSPPLTFADDTIGLGYDAADFEVIGGALMIRNSGISHGGLSDTHNLTTDIDHGSISGLGDDDHSQYHTGARADTWLGTKTTDDLAEGPTHKYESTSVAGAPLSLSGTQIAFHHDPTDFDLNGNDLRIKDSGISHSELSGTHNLTTDIDHGSIAGLTDDDHTQYALLAGRAGGQILTGGTASGNDLDFRTTSHATKGQYLFPDATAASTDILIGGTCNLYASGTTLKTDNTLHAGSISSRTGFVDSFRSGVYGTVRCTYDESGASTDITAGTILGLFRGAGWDGATLLPGADFRVLATQDWVFSTAAGCRVQIAVVPNDATSQVLAATFDQDKSLQIEGLFRIPDGLVAPSTVAGYACTYVDSADGDYKIKFGDSTVVTLARDDGKTMARIVSSLPGSGQAQGEIVFNTGDSKFYGYTGSAWAAFH